MNPFSIIDQLYLQGVEHFCIAPGSRSTPLAIAAIEHKKTKTHLHYDERGLGFFALGLAKANKMPTAVIVTSGTAVGNLLPSIMEAHHSHTPLIILSADRPTYLKDCGANQTTDQVKIFSSFVRSEKDLSSPLKEGHLRSIVANEVFQSMKNPPGPIHINISFDEPLYPVDGEKQEGVAIEMALAQSVASPIHTPFSKGIILMGELPKKGDAQAVLELAQRLNWPVCADILSNARLFDPLEQLCSFEEIESLHCEVILHFGTRLTLKKVASWIRNAKAEYIHISPYPTLLDSERVMTRRVQSDIIPFCQSFSAKKDPSWPPLFKKKTPLFSKTDTFTEVHAMRHLSNMLDEPRAIFLANGMPIRDANRFLFPKHCLGFFANRGLSGIDGNIATIAGIAEKMPVLAIIGDQTALYDLNSLPLLKTSKYPISLVIFNNFGGGIFHHLPIKKYEHFEKYWAAEHSWQFEFAAKMYDIPYERFSQVPSFTPKESCIIELLTTREENYNYQCTLTF